jgi:hypothetical protein
MFGLYRNLYSGRTQFVKQPFGMNETIKSPVFPFFSITPPDSKTIWFNYVFGYFHDTVGLIGAISKEIAKTLKTQPGDISNAVHAHMKGVYRSSCGSGNIFFATPSLARR